MKKGGFLRNVLDTIRSNQTDRPGGAGSQGGAHANKGLESFGGQLKAQHFSLAHVARHGFPENPTALAFDPVQKIGAIGTRSGALRIFGRPGVDVWAQHKPEYAVTHIKFIVNQSALITVTSDESIHLWSLRGPNLKLQFTSATGGISSSSSPAAAPSPATGASSSTSPQSHHYLGQAATADCTQLDDLDYPLSTSPSEPLSKHSRQPECLHTLKFQREHITCLHQTLMSKWLYIGTERGNVHVANVETFELSGYSIAWNKAIELSRKNHPGSIIHISECPQDTNKLLIGYESGCIVLWDLKTRNAEGRYYHTENLLWLSWYYDGKQFIAAHGDGSLVTWQTRSNTRPSNIMYPHAKSDQSSAIATTSPPGENANTQPSFASSFARAMNNELYRPINKVEWKISKNNEQFLLFSGGLPYDGIEQPQQQPPQAQQTVRAQSANQQRQSSAAFPGQQQPQFFKASSASPSGLISTSPISPSLSPQSSVVADATKSSSRQSLTQQQPQAPAVKEKKSLRSTSLTVMYGKSITVLEMGDTMIDFITISENSPYENGTSEPLTVIVLLTNELILIDLTSPGYPSYESPYPAGSLNESPVTCVEYLADCSSDLIPYLYSTSQNVVSRAPKKGFSDKEWPINGGEWGQSMQSYPELVITGHADGTIKFWDMSGVNFDLISKIKTSKLFERPNKLPNSIITAYNNSKKQNTTFGQQQQKPGSPLTKLSPMAAESFSGNTNTAEYSFPSTLNQSTTAATQALDLTAESRLDCGNCFAIEKIEYNSSSRHLLVAGALSQVIQFKLNKQKDSTTAPSGGGGGAHELTTIFIEPTSFGVINDQVGAQTASSSKQHHMLRVKNTAGGSSCPPISSSSSSSSSSHRNRVSAFQAELICLTPMLVSPILVDDSTMPTTMNPASGAAIAYSCQAPPKVTALALQATHSILAYAHETGIVLVDIIQKCVIMSASLADLYGGASIMTNNRDISIQPFATSSILQHHYQANAGGNPTLSSACLNQQQQQQVEPFTTTAQASLAAKPTHRSNHNNGSPDNGNSASSPRSKLIRNVDGAEGEAYDNDFDNGASATSLHKSLGDSIDGQAGQIANSCSSSSSAGKQQQQQQQSRFTSNSMFQRQLSTTALGSAPTGSRTAAPQTVVPRLFQRQMTASQLQLGSSSSSASSAQQEALTNRQRAAALLASARGLDMSPGRAANARLPSAVDTPEKKPAKNKRIISRMLSISAITVGGASNSSHELSGSASNQLVNSAADFSAAPAAATSSDGSTIGACMAGEHQVPDKIDSSFTRSRSSSNSSNAAANTNSDQQSALAESIHCICFLDWAQAGALPNPSSAAAPPASNAANQAASNNKSLGSIDNNSPAGQLALWLGTSQGCVLLVGLAMPTSEDNRVLQLQSVEAEPIPQAAIKLPGAILCLSAFTAQAPSAAHRSASPANQTNASSQSSSLEGEPSASGAANNNQTLRAAQESSSFDSRSFLAVVSEKQAKVYQISGAAAAAPAKESSSSSSGSFSDSHANKTSADSGMQTIGADSPMARFLVNKSNCVCKLDLSDSSFACRSNIIQMRQPEESCLVTYMATGNILVHSLPLMRPLLEADFVPYSNARIASSMCFSRNGHCLYQPSPAEISKFTISAHYKSLVNEMTGSLYVAREMPEMPRTNFFKSLFSASNSVSSKQSERDELFGECGAGKASRGVAKHIATSSATPTGFEKLKGAAAGTMGHDMRVAREGLDERGEKLGEIEDKTLLMMNQSESYAQAAHQLAQKFKDKKWYQF